jgi:hypothetical protein
MEESQLRLKASGKMAFLAWLKNLNTPMLTLYVAEFFGFKGAKGEYSNCQKFLQKTQQ